MSPFEFFFTLYGLVLGLSVVEVVSGFARLAHNRGNVKVGLLTPMLALLMLLDLSHFWLNAYRSFQDYDLSYAVLVIAVGVSALYYVAASVVFPRDFAEEPDFDQAYLRHRRLVIAILVACGVIAFDLIPLLTAEGRASQLAAWSDPAHAIEPLVFFACAGVIVATRNIPANLAALAILIGQHLLTFALTLPR